MILRCNTDSGLMVSGGFLSFLIHDDWTFFLLLGFGTKNEERSGGAFFSCSFVLILQALLGHLPLQHLKRCIAIETGAGKEPFAPGHVLQFCVAPAVVPQGSVSFGI